MRPDFLLTRVLRPLRPIVVGAALSALAACGPGGASSGSTPAVAAKDAADGGSADAAAAADAAPPGKPFAGSPTEATQLIAAAIDSKAGEMRKCVVDYRARKNLPRQRVEVSVAIDQEGRLLGATLKGNKQDAPLSACVQSALAGSLFPRSHAGVIQVTKSYEEIEQ